MAFKLQLAGAAELSAQRFVTEVVIERHLYEHTRAQITLRWHEHSRYDDRQIASLAPGVLNSVVDVQWKDNDLAESVDCFHGYVESVSAQREASCSCLLLECVSFSRRTDLVPRYRAFQATTLLDICRQIARSEPLIKIAKASDLTIDIDLSLQYGETDYQYLSRMLHAWGVPMSTNDATGLVILGARSVEPTAPFPDVGFGWARVTFLGALRALPRQEGGSSGPTSVARAQVGRFNSQLSRKAAGYHAIPPAPLIADNVSAAASQVDTSGYRLRLEGAVLPFAPGQIVPFEGAAHLIRGVRIVGHPQETTATQEFVLQPLTLPLAPERRVPRWPSRAVWAHVVDNEHDPEQRGRIQVKYDWEDMDPQSSHGRAWLHTLTPYGGGAGGSGGKAGVYGGFYSLPEVGERVLVEFVGDWDSEAVVVGVVRQESVRPAYNPRHTKRWRTPSGNEVTMSTREGTEVVRIKCKDKLMFEGKIAGGDQSVTLICGDSDKDLIHFQKSGGGGRLDIHGSQDIFVHAAEHLHVEGNTIQIKAREGLQLHGASVQVQATGGDVHVDGSRIMINTGPLPPLPEEIPGG